MTWPFSLRHLGHLADISGLMKTAPLQRLDLLAFDGGDEILPGALYWSLYLRASSEIFTAAVKRYLFDVVGK